ncbi:MAG: SUMF1/EgtB/PvdO family nonheme iron enzyme [Anaerolineae bacterium]
MPKIFISYRRKSWGFTHRLADDLRERLDAEVFVDTDSIDQADFERSIVTHLRASDAVLLVVSETTFADSIHRDDDWVRREIRETLTLGLPLVLVCVDGLLPPSGLPEDIKDIARRQGINFYPEYFTPAVEKLTDFVTRVSPVRRKGITGSASINLAPDTLTASAVVESPPERTIDGKTTLDEALKLLEDGDYNKAIFLLDELRYSGFKSRFVIIEDLLAQAQQHQELAERRRTAQLEYEEISALVKRRFAREQGLKAFRQWFTDFSDLAAELDTENLRTAPSSTTSLFSRPVDGSMLTPGSRRTDDKGVPMVYVPPGTLLMGSTSQQVNEAVAQAKQENKDAKRQWYERELPQHEVVIASGFWLDLHPVTNEAYARFVKEGGYKERSFWTPGGWEWVQSNKKTEPKEYDKFGDPQQPRVGVTWFEAYAYCQWRGGRLPTEGEWEWAARGPENRIYPWGNTFDANRVIYDKNSGGKTSPVGSGVRSSGASWVGALDMSGNVWEWCSTLYQPYPYRVDDGREGLEDSTNVRVLRGGSWWNYGSSVLRAPFRNWFLPYDEGFDWGFRCARSYNSEF